MSYLTDRLDRQLAKKGETITIKRRIGTSMTDFGTITARARLQGYTGAEIGGGIELRDSKFVISPSSFNAQPTWATGATDTDRFPKRGDFLIDSHGQQRHIEQIERVTVGDEVVRLTGRVR